MMLFKLECFLCITLLHAIICCNSDEFAWGTATAAYQIEGGIQDGGRLPSIWDTFCEESGKVYMNESGAVADDDYHKYVQDIELLVNLGIKYYRLSFAWARIVPDGVNLNMEGINFYRNVINEIKNHGITPLVTLYHWALPQAVYDVTNGGWINETVSDYYLTYVNYVFKYFSEYVKLWITMNEPWTFCVEGYGDGVHAPGRCSNRSFCQYGNSSTEPYLCAHNVLISHGKAVQLFRSKYNTDNSGKIGITLNSNWGVPASTPNNVNYSADVNATERYVLWQVGWFFDPIFFGDYPALMREYIGDRLPTFTSEQQSMIMNSYDFYGLNHYTTYYVANDPDWASKEPTWYTDQRDLNGGYNQYNGSAIGTPCDSEWLFDVPYGIYYMIQYISERYNYPDIYVTENGVDIPNANNLPINEALNDTFRINFYSGYLSYLLNAINDGYKVRGYFAWSLMDNFEWADGYRRRFGIHYVDYNSPDLTRYVKQSAYWYANFTKHNP